MTVLGVAWENILVGLLSGLFVFLVSFAGRRVRDFILEKKYPIAGEYLTQFEDEENGQVVTVTAPATLKQRGKKIIGETYLSYGSRKWILEGQLSNAGHIYGIYHAQDPHDRGIGNFFLYIGHNRVMDGLWSGYDSVNQKITSGKYTFRPKLSTFSIESITTDDIPSIIAISDDELGKDYLTTETLKSISSTAEGARTFCKVAVAPDSGVIGFCIYSMLSSDDLKRRLKVSNEKIPKALLHSERVGMIDVVAVKDQYKRQGVGFHLVSDALTELGKNQINVICSIGWRSRKGINIEGILRYHRFQNLIEYKDYWREDSIVKQYICHDCGQPPCTCSAVLFARFK